MIHDLSRRSEAKFQAVNCAALPDTLFESEIFGYEKGAFTGAHDRKPGRLELANDGTLFLDEIGDLSIVAQAKLLRVLEERRFERLGGNRSISVDFRLISATNRPLDLFVRDERFREDLFYRVNAFAIRLPSLRERPADIPVLAQRFLARYCATNGLPLDAKSFGKDAADQLVAYPWPGNIRELESTVSRAALSSPGPSSAPATSSSCTHRPQRRRRRATGCRRCARPSAGTSCACSRRWAGTRRRHPACSHQPRHPLPEDRGIRAGAPQSVSKRHTAKRGIIAYAPQSPLVLFRFKTLKVGELLCNWRELSAGSQPCVLLRDTTRFGRAPEVRGWAPRILSLSDCSDVVYWLFRNGRSGWQSHCFANSTGRRFWVTLGPRFS